MLSATSSLSGTAITYTAPSTVPNPATVIVTATSIADSTKSNSASITITLAPAISVSVAPPSASVQVLLTQPFTATVTNDSQNKGVIWTLSCTGTCGSLSPLNTSNPVTYTAPSAVPGSTVTIKATSVADPTKSGSAIITVTSAPVISVSIAPSSVSVQVSLTQNFTATVSNDSQNKGVTWTLSGSGCTGAACGSLSNVTTTSVTYTAPAAAPTPPSVTLTATSVADTTKSTSATITVTAPVSVSVTTWHNDNLRSGVNSQETLLTPTSINSTTKFGKKFSCTVDADVYAQPLYVPNVTITGKGAHNVVFVATERNSLYAFDADTNATPCVPLWQKSLMNTGETSLDVNSGDGCGVFTSDIGITSTPVIDLSTQTLYAVTTSKTATPTYFQRLHALSLADGSEKFGGPLLVQGNVPGNGDGSVSGSIAFNAKQHLQRAALLLQSGTVYVAWASYCDADPYHGWVMGFNATGGTLQRASIFNDTPSGSRGGIWMSGAGPAADATGNIYVISGNGTFTATSATPPNTDYGDTFIKLTDTLSVSDWFTPSNESTLEAQDLDVGGGGAVLLVDNPGGPNAHLLIGGGKEGKLYLVNRDNMGHLVSGDTQIVQTFSPAGANGIFASPVFYQGRLYIGAASSSLRAFTFNTSGANAGKFTTTPANSTSTVFGPSSGEAAGTTPSISSSPNGTNGIVWAIDWTATPARAVLHAYDASNLTELWNSSQNAARDQAGPAVKFTVPTIANGRVYVATSGELDVYGLLP